MKLSVLISFLTASSAHGFAIRKNKNTVKSNSFCGKYHPLYSSESEILTEIETVNGISSDELINSKEKIISTLLVKAASSDRGQYATKREKSDIEDIINQIEESITEEPVLSSSIQGTWELLYSDTQLFRSSPFFMAGRGVCQTEEEAKQYDWFCDMHRAALAISNIGKVRQVISDSRMVSEFEVKVGSVPFLPDLTPFAYSGGLPVTVDGAIVSHILTSTSKIAI